MSRRRMRSTVSTRCWRIAAGKPVLVEKAFTRNGAEAAQWFARAAGGRRLLHGGNVDAILAAHGGGAALGCGRALGRHCARERGLWGQPRIRSGVAATLTLRWLVERCLI